MMSLSVFSAGATARVPKSAGTPRAARDSSIARSRASMSMMFLRRASNASMSSFMRVNCSASSAERSRFSDAA